MAERFEHLVDHAEMVLSVMELPLEVDEVGGHAVEPSGEQPRDRQGQTRMAREKRLGIVDDLDMRRTRGANARGVRPLEQDRHLAEHGPRLVDQRDLDIPRKTPIAPSIRTKS